MGDIILTEQNRELKLNEFQNKVNFAVASIFNGNHLSNKSRILRPVFKEINSTFQNSILELGKIVYGDSQFKLRTLNDIYFIIADSAKVLRTMIESNPKHMAVETIVISKKHNPEDYKEKRLRPVNQMCNFIKKKLEPFLIDAYIHGSLSTMDFTDYSDLDTLFIIKQEVMEDFQKIKLLEKLFIESLKYIYEFDYLQHHGHFFLIESELRYYNQSFLPISALELSTFILGRGSNLTFYLRDCQEETKRRFIDSVNLILKYCKGSPELLVRPYYLKKFLSHFMMLPALFLQLNGIYVSKRESFKILKNKIPENKWHIMEFISMLREKWQQKDSIFNITRIVGKINHLLLPYYTKYLNMSSPFHFKIDRIEILRGIRKFTEYLLDLSGIGRDELDKYSV